MKRFTALLIVMILVVSMTGVMTASAACSISGNSSVLAGRSYTYTGKASYKAGDLVGKIEGLGQVDTFFDNAKGFVNASLSGRASIRVTIPASAKPGDKFTITLSGQYSDMASDGSGNSTSKSFSTSKTITVVDKLPETPKSESTPAPPTEWEIAHQGMTDMQQGAAVNLEIKESAKVPAAVLALVQEKQGTLTIDFGGYSCTIDGKNFALPDGMRELDLSMSMEKNEQLSNANGGADVYQLHFAHKGQLPGPVTYRFKAEQNQPGDTLYLYYYYDEAGITEGKQTAVVDADGYVSFTIYHCSSYFVANSPVLGAAGNLDLALVIAEKDMQISTLEAEISALTGQLQQALEAQSQGAETAEQEGENAAPAVSGAVDGLNLSMLELIGMIIAALLLGVVGTLLISRAGRKGRHASSSSDDL